MLGEALAYPRRGDGWLRRIVIGGILSLLGFLFIPQLFVEGYLYRVLGRSARGDEEPPDWTEWVDLLVEGLLMWIVQLVFVIVPVIVVVIGVALGAAGLEAAGAAVMGTGILLTLVVAYIVPAALANFAYTGEFGAAFSASRILEAATSSTYFVHVLLSFVIAIVLGIIGFILSVFIIGIFVLFYTQVAVYYLWARGFARSLDRDAPA